MTHVGIATQRKQCPGVTCQFQRELEMTDISIDQFPNTRQKFITTQRNGHPVLILFLPLLWPFFFLISVILSFSVSLPICLSMCLTLLLMDRALALEWFPLLFWPATMSVRLNCVCQWMHQATGVKHVSLHGDGPYGLHADICSRLV